MKIRHLLLVVIMALTTVDTAVAQAPLSFTYQAVVRNSSGRLVSNATVGVKISIVRDSATGRVVYSCVQRPRTNANGLFSIVIGNSQNGIDTITWRNGPYFLKSEVDPNGGNNYTIVSSQQMLSVPYALHAHTVDNVIGGVNFIERQVLSISNDTVFLTGGSFVVLPPSFSGDYNDLTNKPTIPTNVSAFYNDAGYLTSATLTETQVLSIRHDTVFLTGGSFVKLPAGFSGNYNDLTNKPTIPTVPTNVSAFTNDAGYLTSATLTETQVLSIRHDTVFLTGGSFVKLPAGFSGNYNDLTNKPTIPTVPTNVSAFTNDAGYLTSATLTETQVLSKRGDTIFLTGGSFVVLPAETQNLSDVAANNDSVNSQIKNLYDPTDSMDAVNLRTLNAVISRYDSIINHLIRVIDTLRQDSTHNGSSTFVSGLFSVSSSQQVSFSCGNLQYSTTGTHAVAGGGTAPGTWRFAMHQWDTIGSGNKNTSSSYTGWIDLFGWGTSGYNNKHPYLTSLTYIDYYYSNNISNSNYDWGVYNAISNGGNMPGQWRTLTGNEWYYLLYSRNTNSGIRFAKATVNGIPGLIILPDVWSSTTYALNSTNTTGVAYTANVINSSNWIILENAGCVFLPTSGNRKGTTISNIGTHGNYWSSTQLSNLKPHYMYFNSGNVNTAAYDGNGNYCDGFSVRLVKDTIPPVLPTITTTAASNITDSSATSGGNVTSDGGATVSARGVCWSTSHNPTINESHTSDSTGTGSFTSSITGLTANTTYYVRAYATNSAGTAYGSEVTITTATNIPAGALSGVFSVGANKQVRFSKGNLQWSATGGASVVTEPVYHTTADGIADGIWRFAEHQFDYCGTSNRNPSPSNTGWIDLFGWGTSGYHNSTDPDNINYQPYSTDGSVFIGSSGTQITGYGPSTSMSSADLTGNSANYDWGVYNAISNGGNLPGLWRTLTSSEWNYLLQSRVGATINGVYNARYAKGNVNGTDGIILFPDNYMHPSGVTQPTNFNQYNTSGSINIYTIPEWEQMEAAGCVFLPEAGSRGIRNYSVEYYSSSPYYWSSIHRGELHAFYVAWNNNYYIQCDNYNGRNLGYSVRLVTDVR